MKCKWRFVGWHMTFPIHHNSIKVEYRIAKMVYILYANRETIVIKPFSIYF